MRDGILTEESYRNVARCPPMTLNVSVVSCVGRSPYMYAKKARARRPHGRPHGRTPTSHKTPTQNSRPLCRYRSNRIIGSTWRRAAPQLHFHWSIQEVRTSVGSVAAPRWSLDDRRRLRCPLVRSWPRADPATGVSTAIALPALWFCRQRRRCSVVTPALVSCDSIGTLEHTSTQ